MKAIKHLIAVLLIIYISRFVYKFHVIYEKINVSDIAIALSKRNCKINEFQEKEESLENYYLNLIGGADNA